MRTFKSNYNKSSHYDFKSKELEFELGHETKVKSSDPVLRFGKYQGQRLSETPMSYRIWLKSQSWWKG
jgi:hypothetical protein